MRAFGPAAPVPRQEQVEAHLRVVELAFDHPDPAPERAPGLEVAGDGEPDALPHGPRRTGPRRRDAHVEDLDREVADVAVGLEHPGQKVRDLLPAVDEECIGELYGPDLAPPERGELLPRVLLPSLVERLQHLRGEKVQHVPDTL
jgi:hypothetical protein